MKKILNFNIIDALKGEPNFIDNSQTIEFIKGVDEESNRIRIILEYILNKNVYKTRIKGGFNYEQLLRDVEDLEESLIK
jgi:hypothetical protein